MDGSRRMTAYVAGIIIAVLAAAPTSVRAQAEVTDDLRYSITPYGWLSGLSGTVGLGRVSSNVDLSAADVIKSLKFGIMGTAEVHRGAWLLVADGIYASLGDARTFAIRGDTGGLDLTQHETIIQPMAGYTIGNEVASLDILAGARYWNLSTTLDVDRAVRPSNERSMSQHWVDAIGGLRVRVVPYERVRLVAAVDGGGGGSRDSWQVYSSAGYDVWSQVTLGVAYRVLSVNYDRNDFLFDTRTKGFVVGATFRSW